MYNIGYGKTTELNVMGDFDYIQTGGGATLTKYNGDPRQVIIPEEADGLKVVGFDKIFSYDENIEFVSVPSSVEKIPDDAFYGCKNLKKVKLNDGIKVIGERAFSYCSALTEIEIPPSVETLQGYAFGSSGLERVKLNDGLKNLGESVFHASKLEAVDIPDSVVDIEYFSFYGTKLKDVRLGRGLSVIKRFLFGDTPLERIFIPLGITEIEEKAFCNCKKLAEVTFEDPKGKAMSEKILSNPKKAAKILKKGKPVW